MTANRKMAAHPGGAQVSSELPKSGQVVLEYQGKAHHARPCGADTCCDSQWTVPEGAQVEIDATAGTMQLLESAVT